MTIIRPNSISGVTSITAQGGDINVYRADGTKSDIFINNITGVAATFTGNLNVGGVLTYEDVANIDSVGIITARAAVSIADSIIHTGDTNTSLRFPSNDTITFETAGTEKFRIQPNGRVGIGTDNPPDCTLTVCEFNSGTNIYDNIALRLQGSSGQNVALQFTDTHGAAAYIAVQGDALRLGTNNAERLRIKSDGKVGIGTNNPSQILNIYGTNVKPVIGDRTAHTVHYASYDTQNNTTLEISSSGTGTNVAGLALNNPTTSANSSYKTLTFCCSGTSSGEKRGAIISSNHDAASGSAIKGNLSTMVNNGSGLQTAMFIGHQGNVQKARTAAFSARGQGSSWNTFNSGSGWYSLGDASIGGTNHYINHSWTTSGGGCSVRGVTDAGNSIWENDKARFTAPVAGFYSFEISLYIRALGSSATMHVQPWIESSNLNYYTSNIGHITNSSNSQTNEKQEYPNSVMRTINIYLTANQTFQWAVYAEGTSNFQTYFDYAHQSGYLIG